MTTYKEVDFFKEISQMKISKHIPVNSLHVLKEIPPHDTVNRK